MSKSEQRVQTELLGLRLHPDLHRPLVEAAQAEGQSPTSLARQILADALGYDGPSPSRRPPRQRRPKASPAEIQTAIKFLAQLQAVDQTLRHLARLARAKSGSSDTNSPRWQSALHHQLRESLSLLKDIKSQLIGDST